MSAGQSPHKKRLVKSFVFYTVLDFLEAKEVVVMQSLSTFFYKEKIPGYSAKYESERDDGFSRAKHIRMGHQINNLNLYWRRHSVGVKAIIQPTTRVYLIPQAEQKSASKEVLRYPISRRRAFLEVDHPLSEERAPEEVEQLEKMERTSLELSYSSLPAVMLLDSVDIQWIHQDFVLITGLMTTFLTMPFIGYARPKRSGTVFPMTFPCSIGQFDRMIIMGRFLYLLLHRQAVACEVDLLDPNQTKRMVTLVFQDQTLESTSNSSDSSSDNEEAHEGQASSEEPNPGTELPVVLPRAKIVKLWRLKS